MTTRATRGAAGILAAAVVVGLAGCSAAPLGERYPFIAFGSDFVGFRTWTSQSMESPVAGGSTHVSGLRTVYINALPPPDATAFPVGTMIVKETQADGKLFARVKRGGGYNATGAVDWEWFEIKEATGGAVVVNWHGVGPPAGETYGGDPNAGCNVCHRTASANDFVLSPWLKLAAAPDGGPGDATDGEAPEVGAADGGAPDAETDAAGEVDGADGG